MTIETDWPAHRFRPAERVKVTHRYDEDTDSMIPDDGQPALAFAEAGPYAATWHGVSIPDDANLLGSWSSPVDAGKGEFNGGSRQGFLQCKATRDGSAEERFYPSEWRDLHPNEIAAKAASKFLCKLHGYANGCTIRHPAFKLEATAEAPCALCANDKAGHVAELRAALEAHHRDVAERSRKEAHDLRVGADALDDEAAQHDAQVEAAKTATL